MSIHVMTTCNSAREETNYLLLPDPWGPELMTIMLLPLSERSVEDRREEPRLEPQLDTLQATISNGESVMRVSVVP